MTRKLPLVLVLSIVAILATAAGISVRYLVHARRMTRINLYVDLDDRGSGGFSGWLVDRLAEYEVTPSDGKDAAIHTSDTRFGRESTDLEIRFADVDSPDDRVFALDPYVLLVHSSVEESPIMTTGVTIGRFERWLLSLETKDRIPLVVAGDDETDLAAFVLYLAGELLAPDRFDRVVAAISDGVAEGGETEEILDVLKPVIDKVGLWAQMGLLSANWADWDGIALGDAIVSGRGVSVFARRSAQKSLPRSDRGSYRMYRLPTGEAQRVYKIIGSGVSLGSLDGPRRDSVDVVALLIGSPEIQQEIEDQTLWSPVVSGETFVNRNHRDIVRWIGGAERRIYVTSDMVAHEVFDRLRILFR